MRQRRLHPGWIVGGVCLTAAVIGLSVEQTRAFPRYNNDGNGCITCHGDFDGPDSFTGEIFPSGSKHEMHRANSAMDTDCGLCHTSVGDDPLLFSSAGSGSIPGLGCIGCHGRDYGGDIGVTGAGLRAHHAANGIGLCGNCHTDDPEPLPERIAPPYYGTSGTLADDPCNNEPELLEDWTVTPGVFRGLDNDGDNLYDNDDPDCSCPYDCADQNGVVDTVDFLQLLSQWGMPGTPCDLTGDGVDTVDFLGLLAAWGPCP